MPAKTKVLNESLLPVNRVAGWGRQGIESFMAAQKILFDLVAQQNSLVLGMVRERLTMPSFHAGDAIAKFVDQGVENLSAAGKILLDLVGDETTLAVEGVKKVVPLPVAATTVANVIHHRVATIIDMQKRLLEAASEQTHEVAEVYQSGKGLIAEGGRVPELARRAAESFVETEKKFLDMAAHEVAAARKESDGERKAVRDRNKAFVQMIREGSEKYLEAQKKLLELGLKQVESAGSAASARVEGGRKVARTSWGKLTEDSVRNLVTAQKSLLDLAVKPIKASEAEKKPKVSRKRVARQTKPVEPPEAA